INEDKKSNFGLEVINRLIKPNDNYVKKINDKHITGNKVSGASQFNNNVNIYSEQDTNNMFKELELILPIETINEKLGLKIKTNKESYRFFAKDSIKLSKSMDLKELDVFIYSLTKLLQIKPSYKLLLADEINSNDPIINLLNERLANKFIQFLYNRNSVNELKLYPIQIPCDEQL